MNIVQTVHNNILTFCPVWSESETFIAFRLTFPSFNEGKFFTWESEARQVTHWKCPDKSLTWTIDKWPVEVCPKKAVKGSISKN